MKVFSPFLSHSTSPSSSGRSFVSSSSIISSSSDLFCACLPCLAVRERFVLYIPPYTIISHSRSIDMGRGEVIPLVHALPPLHHHHLLLFLAVEPQIWNWHDQFTIGILTSASDIYFIDLSEALRDSSAAAAASSEYRRAFCSSDAWVRIGWGETGQTHNFLPSFIRIHLNAE